MVRANIYLGNPRILDQWFNHRDAVIFQVVINVDWSNSVELLRRFMNCFLEKSVEQKDLKQALKFVFTPRECMFKVLTCYCCSFLVIHAHQYCLLKLFCFCSPLHHRFLHIIHPRCENTILHTYNQAHNNDFVKG